VQIEELRDKLLHSERRAVEAEGRATEAEGRAMIEAKLRAEAEERAAAAEARVAELLKDLKKVS
jgi:hypothetical protein